jgi:hypothetical protein
MPIKHSYVKYSQSLTNCSVAGDPDSRSLFLFCPSCGIALRERFLETHGLEEILTRQNLAPNGAIAPIREVVEASRFGEFAVEEIDLEDWGSLLD